MLEDSEGAGAFGGCWNIWDGGVFGGSLECLEDAGAFQGLLEYLGDTGAFGMLKHFGGC